MVAFQGIKNGEDLCFTGCNVGYSLGWSGGLVLLLDNKTVEMRQVHTHADFIRVFLRCAHNWWSPCCGFGDMCDHVL